MESPFLTKKIKQKFPQLPGYVIQENRLRATGDTEIEITTNGTYILGQNDEDPDDLEMDEEIPTNSNQQRSLTLSKTGTRDTTSTFTLGKFNVNVPSINNANVDINNNNVITSNGNYTIPNGYTGWNSFTVNVPTTYIELIPNVNFTISTKSNPTQVNTTDFTISKDSYSDLTISNIYAILTFDNISNYFNGKNAISISRAQNNGNSFSTTIYRNTWYCEMAHSNPTSDTDYYVYIKNDNNQWVQVARFYQYTNNNTTYTRIVDVCYLIGYKIIEN